MTKMTTIDPYAQLLGRMPRLTRFFYWLMKRFPKLGKHILSAAMVIYDQAMEEKERRLGESAYKENPIQIIVMSPEDSASLLKEVKN